MSAEHVLTMLNEHEVKFVDLRFTDTKGKEQHVTIPAHQVNAEFFEEGKMFDGSSIGGWKGINESDMVLMPDASTAVIDPFFADSTLIIRCDILEPGTLQGYDRDPRSIAKRAEDYLRSTGIADTVLFGPEPEFFLFDDIRFGSSISGSHVAIDDIEGAWNSSTQYEGGNKGHRPAVKGGYFPVPPVDSAQDIRSEMCLVMEQMGLVVEAHHHEVATAGQNEVATRFNTIPGIRISESSTSGVLLASASSTSAPFSNVVQVKPAPASARSSTQRMELSSSTTQTIPRCINVTFIS